MELKVSRFRWIYPVERSVAYHQHDEVPTFSPRSLYHPTLLALGAAIRRIRKVKGISQEALAAKAGLDRTYIGNVERGESNVAVITLVQIADALDTTLGSLIHEAGLS